MSAAGCKTNERYVTPRNNDEFNDETPLEKRRRLARLRKRRQRARKKLVLDTPPGEPSKVPRSRYYSSSSEDDHVPGPNDGFLQPALQRAMNLMAAEPAREQGPHGDRASSSDGVALDNSFQMPLPDTDESAPDIPIPQSPQRDEFQRDEVGFSSDVSSVLDIQVIETIEEQEQDVGLGNIGVEAEGDAAMLDKQLESYKAANEHDEKVVKRVGDFLCSLQYKHRVSKAAIDEIYKTFCVDLPEDVARIASTSGFPSMKTVRRRREQSIPTIYLDIFEEDDEGKTRKLTRRKTLPAHLVADSKKLRMLCAYTDLGDLIKFFRKIHSSNNDVDFSEVTLSSDGVERNKHGRRTFYQISICFKNCRSPIAWMVWEFTAMHKPTLKELFDPVVHYLEVHNVKLAKVVVDGKEQHYIRGLGATNCYFGCARCVSRGTTRTFGMVHYRMNDLNLTPKTHQMILDVLIQHPEYFASEKALKFHKERRLGVVRYSPLLDLPYFDLVEDIPLDALHLLHIGITKKTWERIFGPDGCFKDCKRRKVVLSRWNQMFIKTKVPTEIRHKTCDIHNSYMKGSNWQCLDMFCLPALVHELEGPEDLRILLLRYSFSVRAYYYNDETFQEISAVLDLEKNDHEFVKLYAKVFDDGCLTFNLHQYVHLNQSRKKHGPLATHSTAIYESMYSKTRYCYLGNCPNAPKQMLGNFLAYQNGHHKCYKKPALHFSTKSSIKTDDTLAYYQGQFFAVLEKSETHLTLQRIKTRSWNTSKLVKLPWSKVGVRVYEDISQDQPISVPRKEIKAKGVRCGPLISSFYPEWVVT